MNRSTVARVAVTCDGTDEVTKLQFLKCKFKGCNFFTHSAGSLKFHTQNTHSQTPRTRDFPCALCQKAFYCSTSLRLHIQRHTQEKIYKCDSCPFTSSILGSLHYHERKSHRQAHQGYPHQEDGSIKYRCEYCGYQTPSVHRILAHTRAVHESEKPFGCPVEGCNFKTRHRAASYNHLKTHKEIPATVYHCDQCNYQTRYLGHLTRHRRQVHSEDRLYACNYKNGECSWRFKTHCELAKHTKIHFSESHRMYCSAPDCEYSTIHGNALKRHLLTHSNERTFECEQCEYKAKTSTDLRKHHMRKHNTDRVKTFKCSFCDKMFYTHEVLKQHIQGHTGEKPFRCDQQPGCSYQTQYQGNLMAHVQRRHSGTRGAPRRLHHVKGRRNQDQARTNSELQYNLRDCFVPLVRLTIWSA